MVHVGGTWRISDRPRGIHYIISWYINTVCLQHGTCRWYMTDLSSPTWYASFGKNTHPNNRPPILHVTYVRSCMIRYEQATHITRYIRHTKQQATHITRYIHHTKQQATHITRYIRHTKQQATHITRYIRQVMHDTIWNWCGLLIHTVIHDVNK